MKMALTTFIIVSFYFLICVRGEAVHYIDQSLVGDLQVTKTTTASIKAECAMKCNFESHQCSAFKFDKDSQTCTLGLIHPSIITCGNEQDSISVRADIFDEDIIQVFISGVGFSYYSVDIALAEPILPTSIPWSTDQNGEAHIKFYLNEAFYYCREILSENCHKWSINSHEWIDTGHKPTELHGGGAFVTFPDNRAVLIGGRSGSYEPQTGIEVMNPDETWSSLVSFSDGVSNAGGCRISDSEALVVGGVTDTLPAINSAWILDIDANTLNSVANMNHVRFHATCAKLNDNEIMALGHWFGEQEVEIYNVADDTWTDTVKFYSQFLLGYSELIIFNGRIILLGGAYDDTSGYVTSDNVFEWTEKDRWLPKDKKLPTPEEDWNGKFMPFIRKYPKPVC